MEDWLDALSLRGNHLSKLRCTQSKCLQTEIEISSTIMPSSNGKPIPRHQDTGAGVDAAAAATACENVLAVYTLSSFQSADMLSDVFSRKMEDGLTV